MSEAGARIGRAWERGRPARWRYTRLLAIPLAVGLIASGSPRPAREVPSAQQRTERFPAGTDFVFYDAAHGRTYFTTSGTLQRQGSGARLALPRCRVHTLDFSADGRYLLLRTDTRDSSVLRATDLRVVRRLPELQAWWEGYRVGFLDETNGYIRTGEHKVRTRIGHREIIRANPTGRFFLANRMIRPGTSQNAGTPTNRLQLWERTKRNAIRLSHDLATVTYDPASEEYPFHLAALDWSLVVFGFPNGIADGEDDIGIWRHGRLTAPLKDPKGRHLQFVQTPLLAGKAIIGLAEAIAPGFVRTGDQFFYRVTAAGIELRPVPANVAFVTYNPTRRAVGWGVTDKAGVTIEYDRQVGRTQTAVPPS